MGCVLMKVAEGGILDEERGDTEELLLVAVVGRCALVVCISDDVCDDVDVGRLLLPAVRLMVVIEVVEEEEVGGVEVEV